MKHLTIYLLCLLVSPVFAQNSYRNTLNKDLEVQKKSFNDTKHQIQNDLDRRIKRFSWDENNASWSLETISEMNYLQNGSLKEIIEHDEAGNPLSKIMFYSLNSGLITGQINMVYEDNTWVNSTKSEQELTSEGDKTREESFIWNNNKWELSFGMKSEKENPTIDQEIITQYSYESTIQKYVPNKRSISNFSNNKLDETIYQEFLNGSWENISAEGYDYDNNGKINTVLYLVWDGQMFQNSEMYSDIKWYNYEKKQFSEMVLRLWNGTQWENSQKAVYQYSLNLGMIGITFQWKNNSWEYQYRISEEYDRQNNPKGFKVENFNGNSWAVLIETKIEYTYDSNNRLLESITQINDQNTWINVSRETVDYNRAMGVDNNKFNLKVYPNPCVDYIQLELENPNANYYRVYDLQGRIVMEEANFNTEVNKIDVSNLTNGYYILEVSQDGALVKEKFLKK